jgi:hypothetical protein
MSLGEALTYEVPDVGGGKNEGLAINAIADNEAEKFVNWYPFGTKMKSRGGSKQITGSAFSEDLTSLFAYKLSIGTWLLLVGSLTGMNKLDGSSVVPLTITDGPAYPSISDPWIMRQYKDEVLAARRGTGTLKRITQDATQNAGISAPAAAPTTVQGAAGLLPAGTYQYVVTFLNQGTIAESNPSPASTALTIAASKKIELSTIPVSTDGQVNARRIYRTLKDNTQEYFFVAQINDNFTTTYSDNVIQDDLGDRVSFDNGLPPSIVELIEIWRERLFASDGVDLFFSGIAHPQGFSEFDVIQVYPDDGHRIRGLLAFGDRLVIGKTNAIHFLVRAGDKYSLQTLSDKHGLRATHSLRTAEGLLFWYSGENVYRSEGVNVSSISTVKIRKSLDQIPEAMRDKVVGFTFPLRSQYWLCCSQGDLTKNEIALVYNYKTDSWSDKVWPLGAPTFVGDFFDANLATIIYSVFSDKNVYQLETGTKDGTTPITRTWRSKAYGYDRPGMMKGLRRVGVLCPTVPEDLTLRVYNDGADSPVGSRTVNLNVPDAWKRIGAPKESMGQLGAITQVELEYSGNTDLDIEGLLIELQAFTRRARVL